MKVTENKNYYNINALLNFIKLNIQNDSIIWDLNIQLIRLLIDSLDISNNIWNFQNIIISIVIKL